MKNYIMLCIILLFITGCNSSETQDSQNSVNNQTTTINEIKDLKNTINNLGNSIEKEFESFTIKIQSNLELAQADEISNDTKAVYGLINGKNTKALLKINGNYNEGYFVVKVYSQKTLVGQSQKIILDSSSSFDFGSISTN